VVRMNTVHKDDQEIVDILQLNIHNGPWIAGGAVLNWYNDTPVQSDIDIFCANEKQAKALLKRIKLSVSNYKCTVVYDTDNAITLDVIKYKPEESTAFTMVSLTPVVLKQWKLQIIKHKYYNSMQDIVDAFDISVCQVATAGNEWVLGDTTARDIRERNLRMIGDIRPSAVKRLLKYMAYGYRPVGGLIERFDNEKYFEFAKEYTF